MPQTDPMSLSHPSQHSDTHVNTARMDILSTIPAITSMLLDDARAVRRSVFDLLCELSKNGKTIQSQGIMENAAEVLFRALHDANPNRRWISVEMVPLLSKYPILHTRLSEMLPQIGSLLMDKDPVIRITTVETLAALSEIKTFYTSIMSQFSAAIDLLNSSTVTIQDDAARLFIECVKYPSTFHDTIMLALPRFKGFLRSPSVLLRSAAKKMIENCAIYPSFHSCIMEMTQTILSEPSSQGISTTDKKLWTWFLKYSDAGSLHKISRDALSTIVSDIKSSQYDVRNWKILALEKLASFPILESSLAAILPKLLANLSQWDQEMLLEVLDPNEMKYNSLRNVITKDLTLAKNSSNLISEIFVSLTRQMFLYRGCPNIRTIKRISFYAYLQDAFIKSIPHFVKRALEGDKGLLIVIVELLKNEDLHEAFSAPTITSLILQTLSPRNYSPDEQTQAMKHHATFVSESHVLSFPGSRYPCLSDTSVLEHTMLLHEARDYECAEKMSGDEDHASSFMHHLIQKMFANEDVKPASEAKAAPNKAAKPNFISCEQAWKGLVTNSDLGVAQSALLMSRIEFEPPAIRILLEFLKRPTLYAALKDNLVDNSGTSFSFTSFLQAELQVTESTESLVWDSIWIYMMRDLVFFPHLYEDLIEILPILCKAFLSDLASAPKAYKLASIITLGTIIQDDLLLLELENNPTITPGMIFQLISTALRDPIPYVRIVAVRICEVLGKRDFRDKAYIHTLIISHEIIPNLMNILSNAQESMDIRYWVVKCLETYSTQNTLHTALTQTISSLLALLANSASESPSSTILPAVLYILICYSRHADLWSIIRDIIAFKLNIPHYEYTIYEPSNVLCDGEFQKYLFVKQTFLDAIPLLLDVLESNPYKNAPPQPEQNCEQKSESTKGTRKEVTKNMKSVNPTSIQAYALKCVIELLRFPSLFTNPLPSPTPSIHNVLLTKYTSILEGEGQTVVIPDETPQTATGGEPSDIDSESAETSEKNNPTASTEPQSYTPKPETKPKSEEGDNTVFLGPHPILQYKAICGLKSHIVTPALYPHILMALERVVDTIEIAIDAGNSSSWIETRYTAAESEHNDGDGSREPVRQMVDALCSLIFGRDPDGNIENSTESTLSYKKIISSSLTETLFERTYDGDENVSELDVLRQYSIRDVESSRKVALLQIIGGFFRYCMN